MYVYVPVCTGMYWYIPVFNSDLVEQELTWGEPFQLILAHVTVCTSMYQYVRVNAGIYWYVLVCTGIYLWYVQGHTFTCKYVAACTSMN